MNLFGHLIIPVNSPNQTSIDLAKIPNHKFQNPNKLQIPISNNQTDFVWNLGNWNLFEIWCLEFGAFICLCAMQFNISPPDRLLLRPGHFLPSWLESPREWPMQWNRFPQGR